MELLILLGDVPHCSISQRQQNARPVMNGRELNLKKPSGEVLYDWLIDDSREVCGIEIHELSDDLPLFTKRNETRSYVQFDAFPQIMFLTPSGAVRGLGAEGFGDIFFYGSPERTDAIRVALDSWLEKHQVERMLNVLKIRP